MAVKVTILGCLFLLSLILFLSLQVTTSKEVKEEKSQSETFPISKSSILKIPFDEEYQIFERDHPKRRRKRFIYYNVDSNFDVGFLVVIPITIVLPGMSNLFNSWRRKRSIENLDDTVNDGYFEDHATLKPHLNRLSTYFDLLSIPEHHCQLRAICEFSSDPSHYFPISEIVLDRIRNPKIPSSVLESYYREMENTDPISQNGTVKVPSLFSVYNKAVDDGLAHGSDNCLKTYGDKCKYSVDKLLSMTTIRLWRVMRSKFGINVKDDFIA